MFNDGRGTIFTLKTHLQQIRSERAKTFLLFVSLVLMLKVGYNEQPILGPVYTEKQCSDVLRDITPI